MMLTDVAMDSALGVNGPVLDRHRVRIFVTVLYAVIVLASRTIVLSLYPFDS